MDNAFLFIAEASNTGLSWLLSVHIHIFWTIIGCSIAPLWEITCIFLFSTNAACWYNGQCLQQSPKAQTASGFRVQFDWQNRSFLHKSPQSHPSSCSTTWFPQPVGVMITFLLTKENEHPSLQLMLHMWEKLQLLNLVPFFWYGFIMYIIFPINILNHHVECQNNDNSMCQIPWQMLWAGVHETTNPTIQFIAACFQRKTRAIIPI